MLAHGSVAAGFDQPLCDAAGKGQLEQVRTLLASKATGQLGTAKTKVGRAALIRACKTGKRSRECSKFFVFGLFEKGCWIHRLTNSVQTQSAN